MGEEQPGLLYVNSKITNSDLLSPELFTHWYEEEHIPDIFKTSGIKSAYRYHTTAGDAGEKVIVDRPYLALYPLRDVAFLESTEFKSIPVHSDLVKTESRCIFDLADFDTRYYGNVEKYDIAESAEPEPFVTTVQFDAPVELSDAADAEVSRWYLEHNKQGATRVRVYSLNFGRHNRDAQEDNHLPSPPRFLALHEFADKKNADGFVGNVVVKQTRAGFRLLRAFGNTQHNF